MAEKLAVVVVGIMLVALMWWAIGKWPPHR
jgi:hypothetical protein